MTDRRFTHARYYVRSWWRWRVNRRIVVRGYDPMSVYTYGSLVLLLAAFWGLVIWAVGRLVSG